MMWLVLPAFLLRSWPHCQLSYQYIYPEFAATLIETRPQVELVSEALTADGQAAGVRSGKENKAAFKAGLASLKHVHLDAQAAGTYVIR